jgi:hypothetical protein
MQIIYCLLENCDHYIMTEDIFKRLIGTTHKAMVCLKIVFTGLLELRRKIKSSFFIYAGILLHVTIPIFYLCGIREPVQHLS